MSANSLKSDSIFPVNPIAGNPNSFNFFNASIEFVEQPLCETTKAKSLSFKLLSE